MVKKLKSLVIELGWGATVLYGLSRIIEHFGPFSRLIYYHITLQPIQTKPRLPAHRGGNFSFRVLTEKADILKSLPRPSKIIESRFKQGSVCIVATLGEEFVGCIWLQLTPYREDEVRSIYKPISPDIAWDYDVYLCESHRMGILFTKLWDEAEEYLRSKSIKFTASRISGFNSKSLNSHRRLGAITVQRIVYLVIGSLQLTFSLKSPWFHLSLSDKHVPTISVKIP